MSNFIRAAIRQAIQAAIEAETDEDTYLPPDLLNHSPGVAKAWVMFNAVGTIQVSHNVASITDSGVGDWTVNLITNFSGIEWVPMITVLKLVSVSIGVIAVSIVAGTCRIAARDHADVLIDPDKIFFAGFGDQ